MEVKTKYELKDRLWTILNNEVREVLVTGISINVTSDGNVIEYNTDYLNDCVSEDKLYSTKEELLKSL